MVKSFISNFDSKFLALRKDARLRVESGTPTQALNAAQKFHSAYPQSAEANFEMARAQSRVGKAIDAMPYAETANKLDPNNANYILVLGRIYLDFRLFEFAAPLLREAIQRLPENLLMQWAMADFLFELGDGHSACEHYEKAMLLGPTLEQKAQLLTDYIRCLSTSDLKSDAINACGELAKIPGSEVAALVRLSNLDKYKNTDIIAKQVEEIASDSANPAEMRSTAWLSLGNMYNNNHHYDAAFEHWNKSRSLKYITHREDIGYQKIAQLKEFYRPELFEQARAYGHRSELPVFVVGMPRSGTTLTEQIIANHQEAFGVGELGRMGLLEPVFRKDYQNKYSFANIIKNAENSELRLRAEETLKLLQLLSPPLKRRVIDKMPTQYLAMGYIALCFPNSKFIHCQRHPADSFISAFQNNMNQFHEYSFDQKLYAEAYLAKQSLMTHWKTCFPQQIFELQYEELVTRPDETVRALIEFVNLPWDENCMQFFNQKRTIKTLSKDQVRNPIYTSSVYRWKNYEKHLGVLFEALDKAQFIYPEL